MANKKLILLAEDEDVLADTLIGQIKEAGMDVLHCSDGESAWDKIQNEKPNLIILDLIMPKENGFEILKNTRALKYHKDTPILILSNLGQEPDIEECMKLGANEYLVKSNVSIEDIVERIKNYLA